MLKSISVILIYRYKEEVRLFVKINLDLKNPNGYVKITLSYNKGICFMENGHLAKVDLTKKLNQNLSTIRN